MSVFQALLLSAVEGVTEFLPVSSTGHLILAGDLLRLPQTEFAKSFEIIIQLGAILAVAVLYWRMLIKNLSIWKTIAAAFLPTAVIGFILYKPIKNFLIGNVTITVAALLLGGIALIGLEKYFRTTPKRDHTIDQLRLSQAGLIGLFQAVSIIPGVSRSAASIIGGMLVGLSRSQAVVFSFLLAIPTMAAATGLDLVKSSGNFSAREWELLTLGFVGAFLTAMVTVKAFVSFIQRHTFIPFGIYRMVIAVMFWVFIGH